MPTNLPPEYFNIEERFRAARSPEEKIACLEEMISVVPKHKGTDRLRADLRRKLSKLRDRSETQKGAARQLSPYHIEREGAGQVTVIGPANVGKSALVDALTNASPEVAEYPFTTWGPTPGMMLVENVQIQLIDTPPLNRDFVEPPMLDLIRRSDLVLLVVDLQAFPIQQIEDTIAFLEEYRIVPRRLLDRESAGKTSVRVLVVVNKNDDGSLDGDFEVFRELLEEDWSMVSVSATTGRNLEQLRWTVYDELGIMRVYSKPPGREPDLSAPFIMERGSTVEEFAAKVHQDFLSKLKTARIWGTDVYDGQMVGRDHVLHDGDVVELRI